MAIQITIIGLGQLGTSAGFVLGKKEIELVRIGSDRSPELGKLAQTEGSIDKFIYNLPSAVEEADIVLLALPVEEIRETLEVIAPVLKAGAVVMDMSPVKNAASGWANELFGEECYFVSITPTLNPVYFLDESLAGNAPHENLFENSLMAITAPAGTHADAIKLATDFTTLLGAAPFFTDPFEAEGLMATSHLLPLMVSSAMVRTAMDQPSWGEIQKVAGVNFGRVTSLLQSTEGAERPAFEIMLNKENLVRLMDDYIQRLSELRDLVQDGEGEALDAYLKGVLAGYQGWMKERLKGDWGKSAKDMELPTAGQMISQMLIGGLGRKRKDKK